MKEINTSPVVDNGGASRWTRRDFLRNSVAAGGSLAFAGSAMAKKEKAASTPKSETLVKTLYDSLDEKQRKKILFPFDHPLRSEVDNNWYIVEDIRLDRDFTKDQQEMVRQIFLGIHSEEYAEKVYKQVEHDSGKKGFMGGSSMAIFGKPGTGKFQFVLTGRHCTRRCDGDSVEGAAFGGPLFYGHAAESFNEKAHHPGNAYWYQAKRANEVFQMLDGKQRERALLLAGRAEEGLDTVKLTGKKNGLDGIRFSELTKDQQEGVMKTLEDVLAPYRPEDVKESMKYIKAAGLDNLHMAFYKRGDIGRDKVWDVWQIEGPSMISYFRGSPHVHAWIHIRKPA